MVLSHNLMAMNGNRQLNINTKSKAKNTEKLSSGYRINRAADDAAGLAISEKMRKQIRGLTQASTNAQEGVSLVQVADGALEEVTDMLQRMNELCIQSANGTGSDSDRQAIQAEIAELKTEIERVGGTTTFNNNHILDGTYANDANLIQKTEEYYSFKTSENSYSGPYTYEEIQQFDGLKILYTNVDEVQTVQSGGGNMFADIANKPHGLNTTQEAYLKNALKTEMVPQAVKGIMDNLPNTFDYLKDSSIGIGLYLYKDTSSGALASVGVGRYGVATPQLIYQLSVNVGSLKFDPGTGELTEESRTELEHTIIHEMTHAFMDEALTNGMTGTGGNKFPGWFKEGMAQATAGAAFNGNDWVNTGLGLNKNSSAADIANKISGSFLLSAETNNSKYATGYLATMYLAQKASGESGVSETSLEHGLDTVLSAIAGNSSHAPRSLEDVVTSLTGKSLADFESGFGHDAASQGFIQSLLKLVGDNGTGGVVAGFSSAGNLLPNSSLDGVTLFQLDTNNESVDNTYPGTYSVFTGGTKDTSGTAGYAGNGIDFELKGGKYGKYDRTPPNFPVYTGHPLTLHVGADATKNNQISINIDGISVRSLALDTVDASTSDGALKAIDNIAFAIHHVTGMRASLGAIQNRLEHTIKNLDNVVENTTAAESQIRDTDMAQTMVAFSKDNILEQAAQAMLAQSNQAPQGVLSLLQ